MTPSTAMVEYPMPRIPSNLAATKAIPGSDIASANIWSCMSSPVQQRQSAELFFLLILYRVSEVKVIIFTSFLSILRKVIFQYNNNYARLSRSKIASQNAKKENVGKYFPKLFLVYLIFLQFRLYSSNTFLEEEKFHAQGM
jgi:hypothetical protein